MKKILLFLAITCSISVIAQNSVYLEFNHKVGSEDLEYNQEFTIPSGDKVALDRCEYYISQITLTHDGGNTTTIEDTWLLVDAFDQEVFDIGEFDIDQVESITFSVGVETPVNNDDPTLWPNQHPLAPQNPSMHWGWSAGYRFLAMEGNSGTNGADFTFQVHALGNANYHDQTLDVDASASAGQINIAIKADYLDAFSNVTTASGGITHGESGDAVDMLNNFRDAVFSVGTVLSIEEDQLDPVSLNIAPNPTVSGEDARLILDSSVNQNFVVEITDLTGKTVFLETISSQSNSMNLPSVKSGVYLINLKNNNALITSQRWVVNK